MSIPRNLSFLAENASSTGVLAVAGGGTGVTTSTGTGSVVFATSPTLTTPNIDSAQFATVSGTAPIYPCRAWVNFNGSGTVAIRASGNVSSITDNGTGDYTVNFTTAMSDVNYSVTSLNRSPGVASGAATQVDVYSTTSVRFLTLNSSYNNYDAVQVSVVIHR